MEMVTGEGKPKKKKDPKERKALPLCTGEGVTYCLKCLDCRQQGKRRVYYRETSRRSYQRGVEHNREIEEGIISHSLVVHFWEEHRGRRQRTMTRIFSKHLTLLKIQVHNQLICLLLAGNQESH